MKHKREAGSEIEPYLGSARDGVEKADRGERKRGGHVEKEMNVTDKRKRGGGVEGGEKAEVYSGAGSEVIKEAEKRKRGGGVEKKKKDHEKLKKGGAVHKKAPMHADGEGLKRHRLDRPGRKRGGGIGSDLSPLSSAARMVEPAKGLTRDVRVDKEED